MSLISDTDFLIHSLRLSYLRDVDDSYAPRIIRFSPTYTSNPYIVAASLADTDRYPELTTPPSPQLSDEEGERPARLQGARLNYTRTIMGRKSGAFGLRVHGKRDPTSSKMSLTPEAKNFVSQNAPVQEAVAPPRDTLADNWVKIADPSEQAPTLQIQAATLVEEAPVTKVVQFVPKFKMAAEMEARRRKRMAARRGMPAPPPPIDSSSPSSDEEIPIAADHDSDSDFGGPDSDASVDSFDPDFVNVRTPVMSSSTLSDLTSEPSAGFSSVPSTSTLPPPRARLSPVTEHKVGTGDGEARVDPVIFDIVNPTVSNERSNDKGKYYPPRRLSGATLPQIPHRHPSVPSLPLIPATSTSAEISFPRKEVAPAKPQKSALTAMLLSSSTSSNPFADIYGAVSGKAETQSTNVLVYFPHATDPHGRPMNLSVRKDATIEEVLGFALLTYWEEGWLPKLDEGLRGEDDSKSTTRLSAVGWVMRIAEDDGEVDDDFPPPDRQQNIIKVNADAYAVLEATPSQIAQNQQADARIQRPTISTRKSDKSASNLVLPGSGIASGSAEVGSALASASLSTSLGPSSAHGPQIYLKVRIAEAADSVLYRTVAATTGMYMQEVLENVCRRWRLSNPKDYVLIIQNGDSSILVALDRTVASIQDKRELMLIKRSMLPQYGLKGPGKTTDPNASIFKRMSEAPEVKISAALDFTAAYKKYLVYRRMPMRVARQERTLAIDGVYVHIMPSNKAKAVFDSGKTNSYHVKTIVDCQQTSKLSSTFRLILNLDGAKKHYEFEAESPKKATEIVQAVRGLKALERSGTVKHSRSSRHGG